MDIDENPDSEVDDNGFHLGFKHGSGQKYGGIPNFSRRQVRYLEKNVKYKSKYLDMRKRMTVKNKHIVFSEESGKPFIRKSKVRSKETKLQKRRKMIIPVALQNHIAQMKVTLTLRPNS